MPQWPVLTSMGLLQIWKTLTGSSCAIVVLALVGLTGASTSQALGPNAIRAGFNSNLLPGTDDGSTGLVSIGFAANFFGTTYHALYINNNGNLTFDAPLSTYTPFNLTSTSQVIIAPFFADVYTRVGNAVTYGPGSADGRPAFGVNWPGVGCFYNNIGVLNYFQVVLIDRSDRAAGDFDIEFNYDQIHWDAGQASGGNSSCQGGSAARVGFSNGTGTSGTSFELPGSGIPGAFLDSNLSTGLIHNSLNSDQYGRYVFQVHGGTPRPAVCIVQLTASDDVFGILVNHPMNFTLAVAIPSAQRTNVPVPCQDLDAIALEVANQEALAVTVSVEVFTHQGASLCTKGPFTLSEHGASGVVFGSDCVPE
jgi:Nidogen-like